MILHRRRAAKRDRLSRTISDTYRSQSQAAPMNREDAWNILCEHTKTEPLRKHALAVEAAMRPYAGKYGEDEDRWAMDELIAFVIESLKPVASQLGIAVSANTG